MISELGQYRRLLEAIGGTEPYIETRDGRRIPKEYHALMLALHQKKLSYVENEVFKGRMHFLLLNRLLDGGRGLRALKADLLKAYLNTWLYFHAKADSDLELFWPHLAENLKTQISDASGAIDLSFLKENFTRLKLAAPQWEDSKTIFEHFAESSKALTSERAGLVKDHRVQEASHLRLVPTPESRPSKSDGRSPP